MYYPIIISGPSGVGKDTLVKAFIAKHPQINEAVGYTTRAPRPGEIPGKDLNFVSKSEFCRLIEKNELVEFAKFNNEFYGLPKSELYKSFKQPTLFNIGVSGARKIKEICPNSISIFLLPPSYKELVKRLGNRGFSRLSNIKQMMLEALSFDYCLISETNKLSETINNFEKILTGDQRFKPVNFKSNIKQIINDHEKFIGRDMN